MAVHVTWYQTPHVIASFWSEEITAADIAGFAADVRALMAEGTPPFYVLADTGDVTKPYMNMGVIRANLRSIMEDERIACGVGYYVHNPIVNFLFAFLSRTFPLNIRTFDKWEAAQSFLQKLGTGLDFSRMPLPPIDDHV